MNNAESANCHLCGDIFYPKRKKDVYCNRCVKVKGRMTKTQFLSFCEKVLNYQPIYKKILEEQYSDMPCVRCGNLHKTKIGGYANCKKCRSEIKVEKKREQAEALERSRKEQEARMKKQKEEAERKRKIINTRTEFNKALVIHGSFERKVSTFSFGFGMRETEFFYLSPDGNIKINQNTNKLEIYDEEKMCWIPKSYLDRDILSLLPKECVAIVNANYSLYN